MDSFVWMIRRTLTSEALFRKPQGDNVHAKN
jgi:hypothetical protein